MLMLCFVWSHPSLFGNMAWLAVTPAPLNLSLVSINCLSLIVKSIVHQSTDVERGWDNLPTDIRRRCSAASSSHYSAGWWWPPVDFPVWIFVDYPEFLMESHCQRHPAVGPAVVAGWLDRLGHMMIHGYLVRSSHLYREIEIKKTTKITINFIAGKQRKLPTLIEFCKQKLGTHPNGRQKIIFIFT